jgi:hypothetical protein
MIDTDPQDGVVVGGSYGHQPSGTAVDLLEPGTNQVFVRIRHSGYKMQVAILESEAESFPNPASLVRARLAIYNRDDGG